MAIAAVIDLEGVTADQHDALATAMGLTGSPLSAVPGLLFHATGPSATGWRVIDVWESEADMERFRREQLVPAFVKVPGLPRPRVEVMPVHHLMR